MSLFLLAGALGFVFYQCLTWAGLPSEDTGFHFGSVEIAFKGDKARIWGQRLLRLALGVALFLALLALHIPVSLADSISKHEAAILLGLVWGPLFAMWLNEVVLNPAGSALTRGQFVAGVGLTLLFLVGSFGSEAGVVLRDYARKISNLKIGVAEVSFSDKSKPGSPGAGALPFSGKSLGSGSESGGLQYFAGLDEMIARDKKYLDLFQRMQLKDLDQLLKETTEGQQQKLTSQRADTVKYWNSTEVTLQRAQEFAGQITKNPMVCLLAWQGQTADSSTVNKHLAVFGDLFRRIQAIGSAQEISDSASGFVRAAILIASDVAASGPGSLIRDKCQPLFDQFCPKLVSIDHALKALDTPNARYKISSEFNVAEREGLRACLQESSKALEELKLAQGQKATEEQKGAEAREKVKEQLTRISTGLQNFMSNDGAEGRPYFVIGYASILAQLGQYEASGVILDGWLQRRSKATEEQKAARWSVAEDWFDIRARAILAAYMEEWVRKESSSATSVALDDHIDNLIFVRTYLQARLRRVPYFAKIFPDPDAQKEVAFKRPGTCSPDINDAEAEDFKLWRQLFETLVSLDLTHLQTRLLHPEGADIFADETNKKVIALANTDLSCIRDENRTSVYYSQILESFARYQLMSAAPRDGEKQDVDDAKKRIAAGIKAAQFGLKVLAAAENDTAREQRSRLPFLKRIQMSEVSDTNEKSKTTLDRLKKAQRDLDQ